MSDRLRNNVIAGFIVVAFWIVFVLPVMAADPIVTDSTSVVTTTGEQTTTVKQPPPSAIAPQFGSGNNSDLCTISSSGSVQTQILGLSVGTTYTEENCLRLKKAQKLYMFGMKVAAVSVIEAVSAKATGALRAFSISAIVTFLLIGVPEGSSTK